MDSENFNTKLRTIADKDDLIHAVMNVNSKSKTYENESSDKRLSRKKKVMV
jgi:hypothetical protein